MRQLNQLDEDDYEDHQSTLFTFPFETPIPRDAFIPVLAAVIFLCCCCCVTAFFKPLKKRKKKKNLKPTFALLNQLNNEEDEEKAAELKMRARLMIEQI